MSASKKQCRVLGLSRTAHYYKPKGESTENQQIMKWIDKGHLEHSAKGVEGCRFTSKERADECGKNPEMKVSKDGHGRAKDNIRIEHFWETIKYEYNYIQPEESGADLYLGVKRFIDNCNFHRRHQGIGRTIPSKLHLRSAACA